jgi:hypothetical protein
LVPTENKLNNNNNTQKPESEPVAPLITSKSFPLLLSRTHLLSWLKEAQMICDGDELLAMAGAARIRSSRRVPVRLSEEFRYSLGTWGWGVGGWVGGFDQNTTVEAS